ncbi:MAG TPA: malto-oligosyltrehalose trehalohydrolase [Gammaproteobacteria bacterium]|nr:malto-oligosyltrehalose trehalohydrolase [Gammaproteobacteria bacterium]
MKARHAMPFGATLVDGGRGVSFSIWAPAARSAVVHVDGAPLEMVPGPGGFFECLAERAAPGSRYAFSFDGAELRVPDPASRFNPDDVHAPSEVVDPESFDWPDASWRGRPWSGAALYELHVGTFTAEGTYDAARSRLDYLAELGMDAIELMPLADTPGRRNWGYDGVLPFAPESRYGRPDALKRFVSAAHERGLMVLLDVVYNHFGPDGNYLHLYAPDFFTARHQTPWGNALNFDGERADAVRSFFIHNALYWLEEYRFDGLRLDAVHGIVDDSDPDFLSELAAEVRRLGAHAGREIHLVLENDRNEARRLRRDAAGKPAAYTSQWNDDFHHAVHVLLTGERGAHYRDYDRPAVRLLRALHEGFVYQGEPSGFRGGASRGEPSGDLPPDAFVNFLQNHDQIGNRADARRLWMLVAHERVRAAETLLLLLPTPILLFMGDEFHARTPFPFFCDFQGELAAAVNEGRRREHAGFGAGGDEPPEPNTPEARGAAVLRWGAIGAPEHAASLERHRALLALRHEVFDGRMPARSAGGDLLGERALRARWRLADGSTLHVVANLDDRELAASRGEGLAPPGDWLASTERLPPAMGPSSIRSSPAPSQLPAWYVLWTLER